MNKRIRWIEVLLTASILCMVPGIGTFPGYGAETQENIINRGWVLSGNDWIFYQEDGSVLRESLTPDGHYVDIEGKWRHRSMTGAGQCGMGRRIVSDRQVG